MGFLDEECPALAIAGSVVGVLVWMAAMVLAGWWGFFAGWLPALMAGYAVVSWWRPLVLIAIVLAAATSGILIGVTVCG